MDYNDLCRIELSIKQAIRELVHVKGVDFGYFQSLMEREGVYNTINECLTSSVDIVEDD